MKVSSLRITIATLAVLALHDAQACNGPKPEERSEICSGDARPDFKCGPKNGNARCGLDGDFCSIYGWCGKTTAYQNGNVCGGANIPKCLGDPRADERCGPSFGNARCLKEGDHCSIYGWCGNTEEHKQKNLCGGPVVLAPQPKCPAQPRADGRCGPSFGGAKCLKGTDFCSQWGWCGNTEDHKAGNVCGQH